MTLAWPTKRVLIETLPLSRANKRLTQVSRSYASTSTTTTSTGKHLRGPRLQSQAELQTYNSIIQQSHTEVDNSLRPPRGSFSVSTFNPNALQPSDYLDISSRWSVTVRLSTENMALEGTRLVYSHSKGRDVTRFPPNTRGFFYLYRPSTIYRVQGLNGAPDKKVTVPVHLMAGELRFRLVDTPDPTKFSEGKDLMAKKRPYNPWGMSLLDLWKFPSHTQVYEAVTSQTERDKIQAFIAHSRETAGNRHSTSFRLGLTPVLDNILEPFVIDFNHNVVPLGLLDADCIVKYHLYHAFISRGSRPHAKSPYSGKALCRLEPAIRHSHSKKMIEGITVRVLKWIECPNPTDVVAQEEGQLAKRWSAVTGDEMLFFTTQPDIPLASRELLLKTFPTPESWPSSFRVNKPPVH